MAPGVRRVPKESRAPEESQVSQLADLAPKALTASQDSEALRDPKEPGPTSLGEIQEDEEGQASLVIREGKVTMGSVSAPSTTLLLDHWALSGIAATPG